MKPLAAGEESTAAIKSAGSEAVTTAEMSAIADQFLGLEKGKDNQRMQIALNEIAMLRWWELWRCRRIATWGIRGEDDGA